MTHGQRHFQYKYNDPSWNTIFTGPLLHACRKHGPRYGALVITL